MPKSEGDVLRKVSSIIVYVNFGCIDRFFLLKDQASNVIVNVEDFLLF